MGHVRRARALARKRWRYDAIGRSQQKDDAIGQPQPKDGGDAEKFDRYRGAALQHGRVAMLAVVGVIAQHSYRFPFVLTGVFGAEGIISH